jgi:hypothetical protein
MDQRPADAASSAATSTMASLTPKPGPAAVPAGQAEQPDTVTAPEDPDTSRHDHADARETLPPKPRKKSARSVKVFATLAGLAAIAATVVIFNVNGPHARPVPPVLRPAGLSAGASSYTTVQIYWSGPATGPEPTRYLVFQNGSQVGWVSGGTTTYEATGLAPSTQYDYQVIAIRGHRRSPLSSALYISTLSPPPLSDAVLTGSFTVHYSGTTWFGLTFTPKLQDQSWSFNPKCAAGPCSVVLHGTIQGSPFSATLHRNGAIYTGTGLERGYLYCTTNHVTDNDYITLKLRIRSASVQGLQWKVASWTGTISLYVPVNTCTAAGISARLDGNAG